MEQIMLEQINKIGEQAVQSAFNVNCGRIPKVLHICSTSDDHVRLYAQKVKNKCRKLKIPCDVIMDKNTHVTNYPYLMTTISNIDDHTYDGLLLDFPFKYDPCMDYVTTRINPDRDMECITPNVYGKYIRSRNNFVRPGVVSVISDLLTLHGYSYRFNNILVLSEFGDIYGLLQAFPKSCITVAHPMHADMVLSQLSDYDIIISLMYDSKICITKETVQFQPTNEQIILDFGWTSELKGSTIMPDIFDKEKSVYYDLSNGLMDLYIYAVLINLFNKFR